MVGAEIVRRWGGEGGEQYEREYLSQQLLREILLLQMEKRRYILRVNVSIIVKDR